MHTPPGKAHAATSPPRLSQLEAPPPPARGGAAAKAAAGAKGAQPLRQLAPPPQQPHARPAAQRADAPKRVAFADQQPRAAPARRDDFSAFDSDADDDGDDDAHAFRAPSPPPRPRATPHPARVDARETARQKLLAAELELRRGFFECLDAFSEPVSGAAREVSREMRQLTRMLVAVDAATGVATTADDSRKKRASGNSGCATVSSDASKP
jgi:hypothetical protein